MPVVGEIGWRLVDVRMYRAKARALLAQRGQARTRDDDTKPNNRHNPVMIVALRAIMPSTTEATSPKLDAISPRSISKPTLKKNNPTRTPRNGEISASIFSLCFEAASIMPDTNEPSVLLSPRPSVRKDMPSTVDRIRPTNASWFCAYTTRPNSGSNANLPQNPSASHPLRPPTVE